MAIELTFEAVRAAAKQVRDSVDEEFTYEKVKDDEGATCHYVRGGKSSCYVAKVLEVLGVPVGLLAAQEGSPAGSVLFNLTTTDVITFPDAPQRYPASEYLDAIQGWQDDGHTWHEAFEHADDYFSCGE